MSRSLCAFLDALAASVSLSRAASSDCIMARQAYFARPGRADGLARQAYYVRWSMADGVERQAYCARWGRAGGVTRQVY